jgi:hypothetical protein
MVRWCDRGVWGDQSSVASPSGKMEQAALKHFRGSRAALEVSSDGTMPGQVSQLAFL